MRIYFLATTKTDGTAMEGAFPNNTCLLTSDRSMRRTGEQAASCFQYLKKVNKQQQICRSRVVRILNLHVLVTAK